ncbi:MAG: ketoacyl-ACP synthase III [Desulfobacteraceae bacterium]|nr:ketoacyl-ACP synthase III [Desulfobacteraceae bacterium]
MSKRSAYIRSIGRYLPERKLTNGDFEEMVDTTDEWILSRTGIHERRILDPGLGNSYMAAPAAKECLERAGVDPEEIDTIIVGTVTPDMVFPSTSCVVQKAIGAKNAFALDINAGCCGFLYSLTVATQMIESGRMNKVLVIGSDVMSTITDYTDRNTCVLFGDAAAAVLLEACGEPGYGILDFILHTDGAGEEHLYMKAGGSRRPSSLETVTNREHFIHQDGPSVFKTAVIEMANVSAEILEKNGLTGDDISLFVPHQANHRIIDAAARRMGIDKGKVVINISKYGNTTSATIPLALYEAVVEKTHRVTRGDYVVMSAFGAGYTWGSILLRWYE